MRIVLSLALLFFVGTAFGLYNVADGVQALERDIRQTNRSIVEEQQAIRVLEAEWTYLNNPARIQALVGEFLPLAQPDGRQVVSFNDVPSQDRPNDLPVPVIPSQKPQAFALASFSEVVSVAPVEEEVTSLPVAVSSVAPVQPKFKPAVQPVSLASAADTDAVSRFEEMVERLNLQWTKGGAE